MYIFVCIILTVFSIVEFFCNNKKITNIFFYLMITALTLFLVFRYGQGTDYFGYLGNYEVSDLHSEIGYMILQRSFRYLGCSFETFAGIIGLIQMLCIYKVTKEHSPYKCMTLLLLYPTIYLTYFFSAIRQGLVIAFFLGYMLKWIHENQYIKYIISCIILSTIHSAFLIVLPLVFIKKIKQRYLYYLIPVAFTLGGALYLSQTDFFSFINLGALQNHIQVKSISIWGFAEKVFMFVLVTVMFVLNERNHGLNKFTCLLYKVYTYGFLVSTTFLPWHLLSSRLAVMMKATEIILLPTLLYKSREYLKHVIYLFICIYVFIMTTKNINSYISQADYQGCTVLTYPYYTIFDKESARKVHSIEWKNIVGGTWWQEEFVNGETTRIIY